MKPVTIGVPLAVVKVITEEKDIREDDPDGVHKLR